MPTAVVVATVVNTNMSQDAFRQHVVEQLRTNDRSLRDKLTDADADANVVTAVLNVEEFLAYLIQRFPKAVDAALSLGVAPEDAATAKQVDERVPLTLSETKKLSEGAFMDHVLDQIETGEVKPIFRMSDQEWREAEDENIGEDFSQYPFLY
jgi:hypothetical protein